VAEVHSREVTSALEHGVEGARLVAFLAVYREGAETALFPSAAVQQGRRVASCFESLSGFAVHGGSLYLFYRTASRFRCDVFHGYSILLYYWRSCSWEGFASCRKEHHGITVIPAHRTSRRWASPEHGDAHSAGGSDSPVDFAMVQDVLAGAKTKGSA